MLKYETPLPVATDRPAGAVWVDGDRARLYQVLGNLLNNAIKFTDKRKNILVRLRPQHSAREAALHVVDSGIGIDPAFLPQLFQPFNQGMVDHERNNRGLGLGLALVKELAQLHGGSVEACSEGAGKGAEFIVRLPLADTADNTHRAKKRRGAGRRILVVEDNLDVARTLRDVLALEGHEVEVAHSGAEALERAHSSKLDVILCDIGLPEMDGYEVVQRVRADERLRSVFLVALTGYASQRDKERAAEAGFDHHLAKPPSIERIREMLATLR